MQILAETLKALRKDPEALEWQKRRECAELLMRQFRDGGVVDREKVMVPLLKRLAADPKWEVRKAIANDLEYVRQAEYDGLVETLGGDCNAYVQRMAKQSRKRRRKLKRCLRGRLQGIDLVLAEYQDLRADYGEEVARRALAVGEAYQMAVIGNIAHAMKNTLFPLCGRTDRLLREIDEGKIDLANLRRSLERNREVQEYHMKLAKQMLSYARSKTITIKPESVPVREAVKAVLGRWRDTKGAKKGGRVCVKVDIPEDLRAMVTRGMLEEALCNVLENAFHAVGAKQGRRYRPRITVTGKAINASEVAIAVRDNGIGVSERDLQEQVIFVPGRTTKPDGAGFGLAIARSYLQLHDGDMVFESKHRRGTTVTMVLPLARRGSEG